MSSNRARDNTESEYTTKQQMFLIYRFDFDIGTLYRRNRNDKSEKGKVKEHALVTVIYLDDFSYKR